MNVKKVRKERKWGLQQNVTMLSGHMNIHTTFYRSSKFVCDSPFFDLLRKSDHIAPPSLRTHLVVSQYVKLSMVQEVDAQYYGFRDDDDGLIVPLELDAEKVGSFIIPEKKSMAFEPINIRWIKTGPEL